MSNQSSNCPLSHFLSYGESPTIAWLQFSQELLAWIFRKGYICEVVTEEDFNLFFDHTNYIWAPRTKPIAPSVDASSKEQRAYKDEVKEYNDGTKEMAEMVDQILALFPDYIKNLFKDPQMRTIGTANCTLKNIYYSARKEFGELTSNDIRSIMAILAAPSDGVEPLRVRIAIHKQQHNILADAGQPLSEFEKSRLLMESLKNQEKAIDIFLYRYPKPSEQKFAKLEKLLIDSDANRRSPRVPNEVSHRADSATTVALIKQLEINLLPKLLAAVNNSNGQRSENEVRAITNKDVQNAARNKLKKKREK